MRHAQWTRSRITAKMPGVSEKYDMTPGILESANRAIKQVTIPAFYCSDPFPLFLVRDHVSCKYGE